MTTLTFAGLVTTLALLALLVTGEVQRAASDSTDHDRRARALGRPIPVHTVPALALASGALLGPHLVDLLT